MNLERALAVTQGTYFVATGVWPIVHLRSFEAVTGPKTCGWLVKTTGALIACVGASLLVAARARRVPRSARALAVLSAAALGASDAIYASRGRIAPTYLLDALAEAGLVLAWGGAAIARRRYARTTTPCAVSASS